jgi:hypothetical protein
MIELILHGIGDYFLQTDYQALNKKKSGLFGIKQCLIHCTTYSIPFFFFYNWKVALVVFITHYIIDRTNLVAWLLAYKNGIRTIENFGFGLERPFAISIWLYIICDNLLHIICNHLSILYLS